MSLEPGERFTKEISYVTKNGKATVTEGHDTINIGPVTCEKGRRVRLKYLGEHEELQQDVGFALCLTEEVLADDYDEYFRNIRQELWDGILAEQLDSRNRPCNFVELMPRLSES